MSQPGEVGDARRHGGPPTVEGISAVSLVTRDMARSVRFYRALGFSLRHGGEHATFTSLHAGSGLTFRLRVCRAGAMRWTTRRGSC